MKEVTGRPWELKCASSAFACSSASSAKAVREVILSDSDYAVFDANGERYFCFQEARIRSLVACFDSLMHHARLTAQGGTPCVPPPKLELRPTRYCVSAPGEHLL